MPPFNLPPGVTQASLDDFYESTQLPQCPNCASDDVSIFINGTPYNPDYRRYECLACTHQWEASLDEPAASPDEELNK
jgi:hypothetical protein